MSYAEASAKLRELRGSWAYAYANSHGCSWGSDPRLDWVHEEEQRLVAIIQEWKEG